MMCLSYNLSGQQADGGRFHGYGHGCSLGLMRVSRLGLGWSVGCGSEGVGGRGGGKRMSPGRIQL